MQNDEVRMQNEENRKKSFNIKRKHGSPRLGSSFIIHHSSFSHAYTLVELFLTIAVLMVVLGLMVNMANRIRRESADRLAREMLQQLAQRMDNYIAANDGNIPEITPLLDMSHVNESTLETTARLNNADFFRCLNLSHALPADRSVAGSDIFIGLERIVPGQPPLLEDPWGNPIVFMPRQSPAIGMAPGDRPFFFSAGPDRAFLTREDNLYSYEESDRINAE